jgi:hypothetical protein
MRQLDEGFAFNHSRELDDLFEVQPPRALELLGVEGL